MKYLKKLYELFNTKNYEWIKGYPFGKKAHFKINDEDYYVCFDEINFNVYNHYFYLEKDNTKYFDIIKTNDNRVFKVFSNIKFILDDFLKENIYAKFIGFSSSENERHDLYVLYSQFIEGYNNLNKFIIKESGKKVFYMIYDENIGNLMLDVYIDRFMKKDKKQN